MHNNEIIEEVTLEERIFLSEENCGIWGTLWRLEISGNLNVENGKYYGNSIYFSSAALQTLKNRFEVLAAELRPFDPPGRSENQR